jgi:hypothetical protein
MAELLFYPVLLLLMILQSVIVRHIPLFNGTADFLLLWLAAWGLHKNGKNIWFGSLFVALLMSFISNTPWYINLLTYLFVAACSRFMSRHFWHNPLIALIIVVFFSSIVGLSLQMGILLFQGLSFDILTTIKTIVIPSIFLNLLFAIPVYIVMNDMAQWVFPIGAEE